MVASFRVGLPLGGLAKGLAVAFDATVPGTTQGAGTTRVASASVAGSAMPQEVPVLDASPVLVLAAASRTTTAP